MSLILMLDIWAFENHCQAKKVSWILPNTCCAVWSPQRHTLSINHCVLVLALILMWRQSTHRNEIYPSIAPPAPAIALILMELQKVADIPNMCTKTILRPNGTTIWSECDWKQIFCCCWNPEILKTIPWREIEFHHIWGNIYPIICKIYYFWLETYF